MSMIMQAFQEHKTMEKDLLKKHLNNSKNNKQWIL